MKIDKEILLWLRIVVVANVVLIGVQLWKLFGAQ